MRINSRMISLRESNSSLHSKFKSLKLCFRNNNLISLSKEHQLDELLDILPSHLKAEINKFLY